MRILRSMFCTNRSFRAQIYTYLIICKIHISNIINYNISLNINKSIEIFFLFLRNKEKKFIKPLFNRQVKLIRTDWLLFFHILRIAFYCRIDIQANIIPTLTRNYAWIDVKISPCFKPSRRSNETRMHIGYTISFSHDRTRVIYLQLTYICIYFTSFPTILSTPL